MRAAAAVALLLLAIAAVQASAYTVNVKVIGYDGAALANTDIVVYNAKGSKVASATTDSNGLAKFTLDAGLYAFVVKAGKYAILYAYNVTGDANITIDATTMHHADLISKPITVTLGILPRGFEAGLPLSTNVTLYASDTVNVTFPETVTKLPLGWRLDTLYVNGSKVSGNKVTLNLAAYDYNVTAVYKQSMTFTSPLILGGLLVAAVAGVVIVMKATSKTAKEAIEEFFAESRRFVRAKSRRW